MNNEIASLLSVLGFVFGCASVIVLFYYATTIDETEA